MKILNTVIVEKESIELKCTDNKQTNKKTMK